MNVRELIALLSGADPDAVVLVFPPHADPCDGGVLEDVIVEEAMWTHETGLCQGSPYETFYPGAPTPVEPSFSNVSTNQVKVVLLGEELNNSRIVTVPS